MYTRRNDYHPIPTIQKGVGVSEGKPRGFKIKGRIKGEFHKYHEDQAFQNRGKDLLDGEEIEVIEYSAYAQLETQLAEAKAEKSSLENKFNEKDEMQQRLFNYAHENVSGEYAGYNIYDALIKEHGWMKFQLQSFKALQTEHANLKEAAAELVEALKFYAAKENYESRDINRHTKNKVYDILLFDFTRDYIPKKDYAGARAREAIESYNAKVGKIV